MTEHARLTRGALSRGVTAAGYEVQTTRPVRSAAECEADLAENWAWYDRLSDLDKAVIDEGRVLPVAETRALLDKYRDNFVTEGWVKRIANAVAAAQGSSWT